MGLAIEAVALEKGLDFVPLQWERFDLVVRRAEYFEPPLQRLFSFARTPAFRDRAAALGGYDVASTGAVVFNAKRQRTSAFLPDPGQPKVQCQTSVEVSNWTCKRKTGRRTLVGSEGSGF